MSAYEYPQVTLSRGTAAPGGLMMTSHSEGPPCAPAPAPPTGGPLTAVVTYTNPEQLLAYEVAPPQGAPVTVMAPNMYIKAKPGFIEGTPVYLVEKKRATRHEVPRYRTDAGYTEGYTEGSYTYTNGSGSSRSESDYTDGSYTYYTEESRGGRPRPSGYSSQSRYSYYPRDRRPQAAGYL